MNGIIYLISLLVCLSFIYMKGIDLYDNLVSCYFAECVSKLKKFSSGVFHVSIILFVNKVIMTFLKGRLCMLSLTCKC